VPQSRTEYEVKPKQQQFTIQSGILTSISSRWRNTVSSCPLHEL